MNYHVNAHALPKALVNRDYFMLLLNFLIFTYVPSSIHLKNKMQLQVRICAKWRAESLTVEAQTLLDSCSTPALHLHNTLYNTLQ